MNLSSLNDAQREAVEYIDGPSLVIAGAGSGKTRVLTYKIAYLLEKGMKPWNIMALTFTNKAANEMKERIAQLMGEDARYLNMGTFHSLFSRILRYEANVIGYTSQFTIYDEADSRSLLKNIIKEMDLDEKVYKPATVHNLISKAKNNTELPSDYRASSSYAMRDRDAMMDRMPVIYETYQQRLRQSNAMDFDDLLLYTYLLFREHDDIRRKYSERYQFVLVDEYQDTNSVQQYIVEQIVAEHRRVCAVGDDAQSIYGFRGANINNILDFQERFATEQTKVRLFKLEQNYRSTQKIVAAANSLIQKNNRQIKKNVFSRNATGESLQLKHCYSDREEAIVVCRDIRSLKLREGLKYSDFAVLYRTNAQSRTFEEQMRKDAIPYRIIGGLSFYQRKEIKDVIAYFRLVVNNQDEEALRRVINYPARGIGKSTIDKVFLHARTRGISAWEVISQPEAVGLAVSKAAMNRLTAFAGMISGFTAANSGKGEGLFGQEGIVPETGRMDAHSLGVNIVKESGVSKDIFSGKEPDDLSRQQNLQELLDSMSEFVDMRTEESGTEHIYLDDFLQEVSLMSDLDSDDASDDKVVLMTIHAAKGLEFPVVFIVGMEENIFPSPMCADSKAGLEEERRLLYVAITRAERHCFLTCAQNRYRYGRMEYDTPSRFLRDINPSYLSVQNLQKDDSEAQLPWNRPRQRTPFSSLQPQQPLQPVTTRTGRRLVPVSNQQSAPSSSAAPSNQPLKVGDKIEHSRFGIGTVLKVDGTGENTKALVEFTYGGQKQLLLKFAKYRVL